MALGQPLTNKRVHIVNNCIMLYGRWVPGISRGLHWGGVDMALGQPLTNKRVHIGTL